MFYDAVPGWWSIPRTDQAGAINVAIRLSACYIDMKDESQWLIIVSCIIVCLVAYRPPTNPLCLKYPADTRPHKYQSVKMPQVPLLPGVRYSVNNLSLIII